QAMAAAAALHPNTTRRKLPPVSGIPAIRWMAAVATLNTTVPSATPHNSHQLHDRVAPSAEARSKPGAMKTIIELITTAGTQTYNSHACDGSQNGFAPSARSYMDATDCIADRPTVTIRLATATVVSIQISSRREFPSVAAGSPTSDRDVRCEARVCCCKSGPRVSGIVGSIRLHKAHRQVEGPAPLPCGGNHIRSPVDPRARTTGVSAVNRRLARNPPQNDISECKFCGGATGYRQSYMAFRSWGRSSGTCVRRSTSQVWLLWT